MIENTPNIDSNPPASEPVNVDVNDIDAIFGDEGDGLEKAAGTTPDSSVSSGQEELIGKSYEEQAKIFQSKLDKTTVKLTAAEQELARKSEYEGVFNSIYEDEEFKQAFLYDLAPDKFQAQDPLAFVQEGLRKEFGDDYNPDEDEDKSRGSKAWLFEKRADTLYAEALKQKDKTELKGLKELKAKREAAKREQATTFEAKKAAIMAKNKWPESVFNGMVDWANKLDIENLSTFYNFALKKKSSTPNLATQVGGAPIMPSGEHAKHLANLFG